jgi:hypothetical protein
MDAMPKKRYRIVIEADLFEDEIIGFKEQLAEIRDVKVIDVKGVVLNGKEK